MDERQKNLSNYRIAEAEDSLKVAAHCLKEDVSEKCKFGSEHIIPVWYYSGNLCT